MFKLCARRWLGLPLEIIMDQKRLNFVIWIIMLVSIVCLALVWIVGRDRNYDRPVLYVYPGNTGDKDRPIRTFRLRYFQAETESDNCMTWTQNEAESPQRHQGCFIVDKGVFAEAVKNSGATMAPQYGKLAFRMAEEIQRAPGIFVAYKTTLTKDLLRRSRGVCTPRTALKAVTAMGYADNDYLPWPSWGNPWEDPEFLQRAETAIASCLSRYWRDLLFMIASSPNTLDVGEAVVKSVKDWQFRDDITIPPDLDKLYD